MKLTYWATCVDVTDDSDIDLPTLVTIDEEGRRVNKQQFLQVCTVPEILKGLLDDPENELILLGFEYGAIYDTEKDIHYLFC